MTRNADRVLEAVRALDHPTAEQVADHLQGTDAPSRATVYRNLSHLVASGRLALREIGDQNRYDPHTGPHIHIHDTRTGRLVDAPMTPQLRAALDEIAANHLETQEACIIEIRGRIKETQP